jgi:hypothetical protein
MKATSLVKKVIISSFHSYSSEIISWAPAAVLSFDSHVDDHFLIAGKASKVLNRLPFADRSAFLRVCIHSLLALKLKLASVNLVTPWGCFQSRAQHDGKAIEQSGVDMGNYLETRLDYLKRIMHLNVFLCPPRDISFVLKKLPKHTTVFDVDIDYFEEFQDFCYSRAPKTIMADGSISKLGSLNDLKRAIKDLHPDRILISEIKLSQIKPFSQPFSNLIYFLKDNGYNIEFGELCESDEVAEVAINKEALYVDIERKELGSQISSIFTTGAPISSLKAVDDDRANLLKQFYERKRNSPEDN